MQNAFAHLDKIKVTGQPAFDGINFKDITKNPSFIKKMGNIELIFSGIDSGFKEWIKAFRLHQWIKNLLIFIPILAAHALITIDNVTVLLLAFLSFSLCVLVT